MNLLQVENIYEEFPPILGEDDVIALDTELSGLKEEQLHRPHGKLASLAGSFDGKNAYIIFDDAQIQEFLDRCSKATWIFHNSTFDLAHLRRWATIPERKNMRDTMLIEKLLYSNYYDDFALADLVRRYLKCYMSKETRKEFHNLEGAMSPDQIKYAALDVIGTWLVDKEQQKIVEPQDMKIWNGMYNPHVWTALELGGFNLDVEAWTRLAEKNQAIVSQAEDELGQLYGHMDKKFVGRGKAKAEVDYFVPFNPASPQQVLELFRSNGIDTESTGDKEVSKFADNPIVRKILDYRIAAKRVNTYGLPYLQYVEPNGKIYTSLNISQAETGRDSSSAPPLQNILKDIEYRKCFIAGKGRKLTIYDYSGQELNEVAYVTQDPKLIEIVNSGKNAYIEIARMSFNEIVEKGNPRYIIIKGLVLGTCYGLTPYGLARDNNVSQEVAEEMYKIFFDDFQVLAAWVKDQQKFNRGITKTILGRKGGLHPYNAQWKNNALNNPFQGSGGDMIKLAMKAFRNTDMYKQYYPTRDVYMVIQVHDELIINWREDLAEGGAKVHASCMNDVANRMHPGIISRVSGGICDNWSEKG